MESKVHRARFYLQQHIAPQSFAMTAHLTIGDVHDILERLARSGISRRRSLVAIEQTIDKHFCYDVGFLTVVVSRFPIEFLTCAR